MISSETRRYVSLQASPPPLIIPLRKFLSFCIPQPSFTFITSLPRLLQALSFLSLSLASLCCLSRQWLLNYWWDVELVRFLQLQTCLLVWGCVVFSNYCHTRLECKCVCAQMYGCICVCLIESTGASPHDFLISKCHCIIRSRNVCTLQHTLSVWVSWLIMGQEDDKRMNRNICFPTSPPWTGSTSSLNTSTPTQ